MNPRTQTRMPQEKPHALQPRSRGLSPFRRSRSPVSPNRRSRSKSPVGRLRSLSPFGRRNHNHEIKNDAVQDEKHPIAEPNYQEHQTIAAKRRSNVLMIHSSAQAIVFRNHLRLARKVIYEEDEEDEEEEEIQEEKEDEESLSSSDSEDDSGEAAFQNMSRQSDRPSSIRELHKSLGESLRESWRDLSTLERHQSEEQVVEQVNELAHSLVPELEQVHLGRDDLSEKSLEIEGLHAHMTPLEELEWNARTEYSPLLQDDRGKEPCADWSPAEREVYALLERQQACIKTIKNSEWPTFLEHFSKPKKMRHAPTQHDDIPPAEGVPFNSFLTSTSLLPPLGRKMRAFGSETSYTVGVIFALPEMKSVEEEAEAVVATKTWAWPAGYAAKTEFNIDHGRLINGRQEALVSLQQLRQYNHEYLYEEDHYIAGKMIKGGFKVVPYNEIYLRVGGPSRIVQQTDVVTGEKRVDSEGTGRSYTKGAGLFIALFVRSYSCNDLICLMRTRARIAYILGEEHVRGIPLLYVHPDKGTRVFTESMQYDFWQQAATKLHPFLNPSLARTLTYHETNETSLQQKLQELIVLTDDMLQKLPATEWASLAGGFGVTDASFSALLRRQASAVELQNVMQCAWAGAIRANDYYTARQVLLLFVIECGRRDGSATKAILDESVAMFSDYAWLEHQVRVLVRLPLPLATKRLRRATNSDGHLIVLGAAQILKSIVTGSAKRRTNESAEAVEQWVQQGEESVAFRLASWKEQRADQADSNIAVSKDSKFMAFITTKSVTNRRKFAQQLHQAVNEFTCVHFLQEMYSIVKSMHSPCMRLELLQYILGLDSRYSIHLVRECIELAATCLSAKNNL